MKRKKCQHCGIGLDTDYADTCQACGKDLGVKKALIVKHEKYNPHNYLDDDIRVVIYMFYNGKTVWIFHKERICSRVFVQGSLKWGISNGCGITTKKEGGNKRHYIIIGDKEVRANFNINDISALLKKIMHTNPPEELLQLIQRPS